MVLFLCARINLAFIYRIAMSRTSRRNLEREVPSVLVPIENRASLARRFNNNPIQAYPGANDWHRSVSTSSSSTRGGAFVAVSTSHQTTRGGLVLVDNRNMESASKGKQKICENIDVMDIDNEKQVVFEQCDLYAQGFPVFEEIRRQGKLCDVTLKVGHNVNTP